MTTFVPDLVTECAAFSRPMAFGAFEISHHLRTQDSEWSKPVGERDTTRCGGGPIQLVKANTKAPRLSRTRARLDNDVRKYLWQ